MQETWLWFCFGLWGIIWDHFQIALLEVLEVLLDLLWPLHTVLGLQVDLGLLKMVTNDSPYPKTLVLLPEACLWHAQKLS